jgi:hypothetical protein
MFGWITPHQASPCPTAVQRGQQHSITGLRKGAGAQSGTTPPALNDAQEEQYDADVETAVDSARLWFNTTAVATFGPPRSDQLIVFDIDETLLCNIKVLICPL